MTGLNRVILAGTLTKDPELVELPSGTQLCSLNLRVDNNYKDRKTKQNKQDTCFIEVKTFGNTAESCNKYLNKLRSILVEGHLKFDSWEDSKTGKSRSKHLVIADRVIFLN